MVLYVFYVDFNIFHLKIGFYRSMCFDAVKYLHTVDDIPWIIFFNLITQFKSRSQINVLTIIFSVSEEQQDNSKICMYATDIIGILNKFCDQKSFICY